MLLGATAGDTRGVGSYTQTLTRHAALSLAFVMAAALSLKGSLHAEAPHTGGGPSMPRVQSPFAMPDGLGEKKKGHGIALDADIPEPRYEGEPLVKRPPSRSVEDAHGTRTTRFGVTALNLHTRELFAVAPTVAAPDLRAPFDRFLRCRVTGRGTNMRREPFLVALKVARHFGKNRIEIVSGFRSPKFNEHLRKKGHGVATQSHHTLGEALDFRIPGIPARRLAKAVASVHKGGIGTYVKNDFVHVDVGRDRRWGGL